MEREKGMQKKLLEGKKVAILIESEYVYSEIEFYNRFFIQNGATIDYMTYLWGKPSRTIICDITDTENPAAQIHTMGVYKDISECSVEDYDIVLVAANYVAVRLREIMPMGSLGSIESISSPPAVQFFAEAMKNKKIIKGCLCHSLWLLTAVPELLKDRKVICHTVVLADIHNAGAIFIPDESHVVVDDDLVTARSAADVEAYLNAIVDALEKRD